MKTNVKTSRVSPAFAFITPENFSLEYYHSNDCHVVDSSIAFAELSGSIESKIPIVLDQLNLDPGGLIIILSAQLTLYSEQVFPNGLSSPQIGELLVLQLLKRLSSASTATYYDYFFLKKAKESSTYGLIEARRDVLNKCMDGFEHCGLETLAIVSQPIVLLNYILENNSITTDLYKIVCILDLRIYIASIKDNHVEELIEHVTAPESLSAASMANIVISQLDLDSHGLNQPIIIVDTLDCGVAQELAERRADNIRIDPNFIPEKTLGENTIKWLRIEDDMYKSVAMA